jgi:hypothetical protein
MATDPRSQAILSEIAGLSQAAPSAQIAPQTETVPNETGPSTFESITGTGAAFAGTESTRKEPLTRADAILGEVASLGKTVPQSREQAIVTEQEALIARQNQPLISGGSFLEKALDVINTPQQMMFGLMSRPENESPWDAMIRGAKQNARFLDVMQADFDADPKSFVNRAIGLSGDILLDPLNLLAGPIMKGVSKGLKLTGAVGVSAAKAIAPNLSERLFESAVKPLVHLFSRTALRTAAEKDLIGMIDIELGKAQATAQRILIEEGQARKVASNVAQKLGLPEETVLGEVARRVEIKTGSQLAFPFATLDKSKKLLESPQLDFFTKGELSKEFAVIEERLNVARADFQGALPLAYVEEREIALQATNLKQRLENALLKERSFGIKINRLDDSTVDYLTHLTTPEAKKILVDLPQFRSFGRMFNPRMAFQLARQLDETTPAIARAIEQGGKADIQTLNRLWQSGELFPQLGPQTSKLFTDDPFIASAVRRIRGEKALADAQILIKTAGDRRFALPAAEAPAHFRPLNLPSDARFDRLRVYTDKFRYEPEIATHLEKTIETTLLPEGLDKFLKTFDTIQNVWKGLTLSPFPAYHLRNMVGNIWNNYLAGLDNPKWYGMATRLQLVPRQFARMERELGLIKAGAPQVPIRAAEEAIATTIARAEVLPSFTLGGTKYNSPALLQMLDDFGIRQGTFVEGEVIRKGMPGMAGRVYFGAEDIPGFGKVVKKGMEVGRSIENNARIAHFMWRLDKGDTAMQAALSTKKYLFDYSKGLTKFEQSVMRRVLLFYAWTRFNVPLQIESLVSNPRPYVRLSELVSTLRTLGEEAVPMPPRGFGPEAPSSEFAKKAAEYRGADQRYLAAWIKDSVGIPYRLGPTGEPEYFLLAGWLPAGDVNSITPSGAYNRLRDLLSPFLRTPIEQLTNTDLFRAEQLEKFPGETGRFLGLEMRKRNIQMLKNLRLLGEADRVLKLWQQTDELTEPELSNLGAITRSIFGLKSYEAKPHFEAVRIRRERTEHLKQMKSSVRRELYGAAERLRGEITGEEEEE